MRAYLADPIPRTGRKVLVPLPLLRRTLSPEYHRLMPRAIRDEEGTESGSPRIYGCTLFQYSTRQLRDSRSRP